MGDSRFVIGSDELRALDAVLIAGPTASGKSALALKLARDYGGAVINADAMQVYRELRVLSARPDADEERQAPHYLYGFVSAFEPFSVGALARGGEGRARRCAREGAAADRRRRDRALLRGAAARACRRSRRSMRRSASRRGRSSPRSATNAFTPSLRRAIR